MSKYHLDFKLAHLYMFMVYIHFTFTLCDFTVSRLVYSAIIFRIMSLAPSQSMAEFMDLRVPKQDRLLICGTKLPN